MKKINKILVPVDFTPVSNNALEFAIQLALPFKAKIKILHAYAVPIAIEPATGFVTAPQQIDHKQLAEEQIAELKDKIPQLNEVRHEMATILGNLTEAVESIESSEHIDLIVMGTKGAEGLKALFMGTNTADVVNNSHIPMLIIPEGVRYKAIRKIAFAYDFNGIAQPDKLDLLESLSNFFNADLHVLNIMEHMNPDKDEDYSSIHVLRKKFASVKHDYKFRIRDDIEEGITQYVQDNQIDLLAAMPRKHNFFEKIFKKSISSRLTFHTEIPLLLLKN